MLVRSGSLFSSAVLRALLSAALGATLIPTLGCPGTTSTGDAGDGDGDGDGGVVDDQDAGDGDGDGDGDTSPDPAFVSQTTLTDHIAYLASDDLEGRDEGSTGGAAARDYLIQKLTDCGVQPGNGDSYTQPITTGDGVNILGFIEGTDDAVNDRVIIVSAHYDHLGVFGGQVYNGAMDNAAAVSIAVQVGCALADTPPARSILIALWDAEEPPTFLTDAMGSEFFGANPTLDLNDVDVAIAMDLMGGGLWPGYKAHVGFGAELSREVAAAFDATPRPEGIDVIRGGLHLFEERPTGHLPLSDYDAFRNRGVPVLFLTDGTNKTYHQPNDDLDQLDPAKLAGEARFLLDLTWRLGTADATPSFSQGSDDLADAQLVLKLLNDALATDGLVDALNLSTTSEDQLTSDRDAAAAIVTKLEGGATANQNDIGQLRTGLQRAQCLAGTDYDELVCNFL